MANSVPDTYFTDRKPESFPDNWVRPARGSWLNAAILFYEYGLPKSDSMFWAGFAATTSKVGISDFDKNEAVKAYMVGKGLDKEGIAKKAVVSLESINNRLRKMVMASMKTTGEKFIDVIREIRENYKAQYQFAGGSFVTKHKVGGDDENPLTGHFTFGWNDNGDGNPDGDSEGK